MQTYDLIIGFSGLIKAKSTALTMSITAIYVNHFSEFVLVVCYVQFLLLLDMDVLLWERNLNAVLVEGVVDAAEHFADDV